MEKNNPTQKSAFESRMTYIEGASELSPSIYNVIIGIMLTWGFGINYLLCKFASYPILRAIYTASSPQTILIIGLIAYFVLAMLGSRMVRAQSVVTSFVGYNLIVVPVGVLLTVCVAGYDPYIVTRAAMATACVTILMMMVSAIKPEFFLRIGPALLVALFSVIIVELLGTIFFRMGNNTVIDYIVIAIMGLFIGFDWARANTIQRTPTNAITVAASLYLDIINIFLRILSIMGKRKN